MGVSGTGKSTLAKAIVETTSGMFIEGDDLHPKQNIEKMRAGTPLTDKDRSGWLTTLAQTIETHDADPRWIAVTCSALKRGYRARLAGASNRVGFVCLRAQAALLEERMAARLEQGVHFMPPELLKSQLETFEPPAAGEAPRGLTVLPAEIKTSEQVRRVLETFGA